LVADLVSFYYDDIIFNTPDDQKPEAFKKFFSGMALNTAKHFEKLIGWYGSNLSQLIGLVKCVEIRLRKDGHPASSVSQHALHCSLRSFLIIDFLRATNSGVKIPVIGSMGTLTILQHDDTVCLYRSMSFV
jgi:hypothetical protein